MSTNPLFIPQTDEERAEASRSLTQCFADIERLDELVKSPLSVEDGSVLWLDDRFTRPFQTSHIVNYLILTAVDHLHCLKTVMQDAESQHIFAPFTLIRSSIEAATTAVWLLSPNDRRTRVTRSLQSERNNLSMFEKAYATMGVDTRESSAPRLALLRAAVDKSGIDIDAVMGSSPSVQTIIKKASKEAGLSRWILAAWQLSSGSAHGKSWAGVHTSTFTETEGSSTEEVLSGVLTSDEISIVRVLFAALAVVNRAIRLQERRAKRRPQSPGESFVKLPTCPHDSSFMISTRLVLD